MDILATPALKLRACSCQMHDADSHSIHSLRTNRNEMHGLHGACDRRSEAARNTLLTAKGLHMMCNTHIYIIFVGSPAKIATQTNVANPVNSQHSFTLSVESS